MKILVTGGSGYLASWIINYLLEKGHEVNTTGRHLNNNAKYNHLYEIDKRTSGNLSLFEADLLKEDSFDKAAEGCEVLIHCASPFFITNIKDPQKDLIEPAHKGTINVLSAVKKAGTFKKVVKTSSVVAIYGDSVDAAAKADLTLSEEDWNETSSIEHLPYSYSKTLAEREIWSIHNGQDQWELAVINPAFILGPSLTKRNDSTSIDFMIKMANGTFKSGVPAVYYGIVDVRDVAAAHVKAALNDGIKGRFILSNETKSLWELAQILHSEYGEKYKFPKMRVPKLLMYLIGPANGYSRKFVKRNVNHKIYYNNNRSKEVLGVNYSPLLQTLKDQMEQIEKDGLIN